MLVGRGRLLQRHGQPLWRRLPRPSPPHHGLQGQPDRPGHGRGGGVGEHGLQRGRRRRSSSRTGSMTSPQRHRQPPPLKRRKTKTKMRMTVTRILQKDFQANFSVPFPSQSALSCDSPAKNTLRETLYDCKSKCSSNYYVPKNIFSGFSSQVSLVSYVSEI